MTRRSPKSNPTVGFYAQTGDAVFDAGSRADRDGSLAAFLKPGLTPPERTVAQVEGWILGVA